MALVPVTWNSGPEGRVAPATEATAAVGAAASGTSELLNPGTQAPVTDEHSHCAPVSTFTQGVVGVFAAVQAAPCGGSSWNKPLAIGLPPFAELYCGAISTMSPLG